MAAIVKLFRERKGTNIREEGKEKKLEKGYG